MTKKPINDLAASIKQRLINKARQDGNDINLYWTRYATERLLYRLSISPHADTYILKGAMLFVVWSDLLLRPTMDLDLLGFGEDSIARLESVFREIATMQTNDQDGIVFDAASVQVAPIRENQEYQGKRVTMLAHLGTIEIHLQIDIGFGDVISPAPETLIFPTLLDHAAPHLRASTRETAIAEKFHVMVIRGLANSRIKDYFDIWILSRQFSFDAPTLLQAMRATFERRRTAFPDSVPIALSEEYARTPLARAWKRFAARTIASDRSLQEVVSDLTAFLGPILENPNTFHRWDPCGPWQKTRGERQPTG